MKIHYPVKIESESEIPDDDLKRYLLQHLLLDSDMMEASKPLALKEMETKLHGALSEDQFGNCMVYTRAYLRYLLDFLSAMPCLKLEF